MAGICYIIGAGSVRGAVCRPRKGDLVIAADGGFLALKALNVEPDIVVGDFDSLGFVPDGCETIRHPAEKDDTDMMLAVNEGLKRGYRIFSLLGGIGGRLDHTMANLQTLSFIAENGACGYLAGEGVAAAVIKNAVMHIPAGRKGFISVFSSGGTARGVYLRGLKYTLSDAVLPHTVTLGTSNEFTDDAAEIEVRDGELTVMWYESDFDPASCGITIYRREI